jgi:hypothetical protein
VKNKTLVYKVFDEAAGIKSVTNEWKTEEELTKIEWGLAYLKTGEAGRCRVPLVV